VSHIFIIGYGGEVTIKWTVESDSSGIFWLLPIMILCSVCMARAFLSIRVRGAFTFFGDDLCAFMFEI
jgi:hypothetical protein